MNESKPKIFIFINGGEPDFLSVSALSEDGCFLGGHISSNEGFAKHDMGIGSDWKHEVYNRHYPDGWELVWVDKIKEDVAAMKAYDTHLAYTKEQYDERMKDHEPITKPGVTITFSDKQKEPVGTDIP